MKKSKKPNILFITSDQQHWNTLGCLNPEIKTPNLDRLAQRGTVFTRAYCPNPTCTPTRASLITGMMPSQHGAYSLGTKLDESVPTIGDVLHGDGYKTALVGKAHFQPLNGTDQFPSLESYPVLQDLGFWKQFSEPFYGFRHVEITRNHADEAHVGQHYALWLEEKGCHNWRDYFQPPTGTNKDQKHRWLIPEEFHYNTWIAERTNALMDDYSEADDPFFLWASFLDPHPPYLAPEPWDSMYDPNFIHLPELTPGEHDRNPPHFQKTQEKSPDFSEWKEPDGNALHGCHSHLHDPEEMRKDIAVYYGMISLMDKYIGQIFDHLKKTGLDQNTLIVFTSDHGHLFGQHGMIAKGPFHYEDLVRVPMIVSWPGHIPANQRSEALQSLVDIPATLLSAAGAGAPGIMSGLDQSPVWFGNAEGVRDHVLVENRHQPTTLQLHTCIDSRYKITAYRDRQYGELFDLEQDPGEVSNLWDNPEYAGLKAHLLLKLISAEMKKEPPWMPRIAGA